MPNLGYMGYPLIEAVFGSQMLLYMMIFTVSYQIVIYTYGIYILNPNREFSLKKIVNPNLVAMVLGAFAGLLELKLPAAVNSILQSAKGCMAVSAMILTGFVLGAVSFKPLLRDIRLYLAALVRGILIPVAAYGVLLLLPVEKELMVVVCATLAMPMGLNSVVFPEAYGGDGLTGAKTSFVSNLLCLLTIPAVFLLLSR